MKLETSLSSTSSALGVLLCLLTGATVPQTTRADLGGDLGAPAPSANVTASPVAPGYPSVGTLPAPPEAAPLTSLFPSQGPLVSAQVATKLRVLDTDLNYLGGRGRNRVVDGILSMVTGGLSIALGVIVDEQSLSDYLYVYGGAGVARGLLHLFLGSNPSDAALEFSHMPMASEQDAQARLRFGENALESIADADRLSRILDASLNILTGAAFVPLYLGPNDYEIDTFGAIVLVTAGVSVVTGAINLFTMSESERRLDAYEAMKNRLSPGPQARRTWQFQAGAGPAGAMVGARNRF